MRGSNPCSSVGRGYNDDLGKQQRKGGCLHSTVKVPAEHPPAFPCTDCRSTESIHAVFQPSINLLPLLCADTLKVIKNG